jgi:hypothetical protein
MTPNKPERQLIKFIEKHNLPFKYTGNFKRAITSGVITKFPDFTHFSGGAVIEVVGDVFHDAAQHKRIYGTNLPYHRTVDGMLDFYNSKGILCICIPEKKCYDEKWLERAFAVYL